MPARGHRRDDRVPAAGIPHEALEAHPNQQHIRATQPRNQAQDTGRRSVPRRPRSALMLVTARIRHVTQAWPDRRYLDMSLLEPMKDMVETPHAGNQG